MKLDYQLPVALGGVFKEMHYWLFVQPHRPCKQGTWPLCHLSNHTNYTIMCKTLSLLMHTNYANIGNEGKTNLATNIMRTEHGNDAKWKLVGKNMNIPNNDTMKKISQSDLKLSWCAYLQMCNFKFYWCAYLQVHDVKLYWCACLQMHDLKFYWSTDIQALDMKSCWCAYFQVCDLKFYWCTYFQGLHLKFYWSAYLKYMTSSFVDSPALSAWP
jgi:hypothetical protein